MLTSDDLCRLRVSQACVGCRFCAVIHLSRALASQPFLCVQCEQEAAQGSVESSVDVGAN